MKKKLHSPLVIFLLAFFSLPLIWSFEKNAEIQQKSLNIQANILHWIQNKGQFDENIAFIRNTPLSNIQVNNDGDITYQLKGKQTPVKIVETWLDDERKLEPRGLNKAPAVIHYFKGNPEDFIQDIPSFQKISLGQAWPGIQVELHSKNQNMEKIFIVGENANPDQIAVKLEGQTDICISDDAGLQLDLQDGSFVKFSPPIAWQEIDGEKRTIPVAYKLIPGQNSYGFELGVYDPSQELFIDPLLSSTFIGGSRWDYADVLKIGRNNKIYVAGVTESEDLLTTDESYQPHYIDTTDMFVALYNEDMTILEACTFIGGSGVDLLRDIVLDTSDNVYLTGMTQSEDYPVSPNCFDPSYNNPGDAWFFDVMISSLSSDLSDLRYSTYLGTSHTENANAIDIDSSQNILITGQTYGNLPEVGAIFNNHVTDFFFVKFDHELENILASNSLSGNNYISPRDLVVDSSENVIIVGDTWATDLPVGPQAFAPVNTGNRDGYIVKLNNDLNELLAASYYGGKLDEELHSVAVTPDNTIYFSGNSTSIDVPLGPAPFDSLNTYGSFPATDCIIAVMDSSLTTLKSASYLGEKGEETAYDITFDSLGNVLVTGYTTSTGLPVFCNSFDPNYNEGEDAFITKFSDDLSTVLASTYVGGTKSDHSYSIECNKGDSVFIAGYTTSPDFPINQPVDAIFDGGPSDGFAFSIDPELDKQFPCCSEMIYPVPHTAVEPGSQLVEWTEAVGALGYLLSIGNEADTFNILYQFDMEDRLEYTLSDLACNDTIYVLIQAYNSQGYDPACALSWFTTRESFLSMEYAEICEGDSYEWQGNALTSAGTYEEIYTDVYGCDSTYQLELSVFSSYYDYEFAEICQDEFYLWQGNFLQSSGTYYENYISVDGCDSIFELELQVYPVYEFIEHDTICEGETYSWEGLSLSLPGLYINHLISMDGCDSTLNLLLSVRDNYSYFDTLGICPGDTLYWQGNNYDSPGNYQKSYTSINGCDSTYYLSLSFLPEYIYNEFHSMCQGDSFLWQEMTLSEAGYYEVIYTAINNCDSTYTLDLSIPQPDTSVYSAENTLFVNDDQNSSYQWVTCPDYQVIEGATDPVFEIDSSGTYAVIVEKSGCIDTSRCVSIIHTGLNEMDKEFGIEVYPNPVSHQDLTLNISEPGTGYHISIFTLDGKKVFEDFFEATEIKIHTKNYASGVYWLKYQNKDRTIVRKVVVDR